MELANQQEYKALVNQISSAYEQGRQRAIQAVGTQLVQTYWEIGQYIVEFEQGGEIRAGYGKALINNLADDLSRLHGRGFSRSNLIYMRLFYLEYSISEKASHLLSWSHYVELLKIEDSLKRSFYEQQIILEKWSIRELQALIGKVTWMREVVEWICGEKTGNVALYPKHVYLWV